MKAAWRIHVASGLVASLLVFAVGAILDFAVTANPNQHGVNLNTIGVILMIVGVVGAIAALALFSLGSGGIRRHRTLIDDGNGNVMRREDSYQ
jgi:uncharacterized membrane protein YidH (DUF202 family)